MVYDEGLAREIRALLGSQRGVEEKRMFGGLAFLIDGNMSVAVSGQGGLLVRVPPDETGELVRRAHVSPMVMGGRETRGWVRVEAAGVRTRRQLESWVARGIGYARGLPPKCRRG
jgi:TfoX N-terminal domain